MNLEKMKRALSALLVALLLCGVPGAALAEEFSAAAPDETILTQTEPATQAAQPITEEPAQPQPATQPAAEEPTQPEETAAEPATQPAAAPPAAAPEIAPQAANEDCSFYPVVTLCGAWHALYLNEKTPDEQAVFGGENGAWESINGRLETVMEKLKSLDLKGVIDEALGMLWDIFGPIRMDENGDSVTPDITSIQHNNEYFDWGTMFGGTYQFSFDWRLGPVDNARLLHTFIERVLAYTGAAKVNVITLSGSAPLMLCYLKLYENQTSPGGPERRLASTVFNASTLNGSEFFGAAAKKQVEINIDALMHVTNFWGTPFDINEKAPWLQILYQPGILHVAERLLKIASGSLNRRVYDEAATQLIYTNMGLWTYVPLADYETAKKAQFGGDPAKYATLVARMDDYRYNYQARQDEIIQDAAQRMKMAVRVAYGFVGLPIGKNAYVQSDGTVDTHGASFGANCAPWEQPFSSRYVQQRYPERDYISPDRMIDASSCLLPEYTWFAKGQQHQTIDYNYMADENDIDYSRPFGARFGWYSWFLRTTGPTDVFADEKYPQFLEIGAEELPNRGDLGLGYHSYHPLQAPEPATWVDVLKGAGLWIMKAWRWILLLPLFWVAFL